MKKFLKYFALSLVVLISVLVVTCSYFSKDLPVGKSGEEADALAHTMWTALNKEAWDSTRFVSWSFRGEHHYLWHKEANLAQIKWDNHTVLLDPDKVDGLYLKNGEWVKDNSKIQKAWSYWCNDMFWLTAPFKIKDIGTELSKVNDSTLVVSYTSGGVTPGDSYVWKLAADGKPKAYEMHVSILPVKGLSATWEGWEATSTGALLASKHIIAGQPLSLSPIKTGMRLEDLGVKDDIFAPIKE